MSGAPLPRACVLVVDDNEPNRALAKAALEAEDFTVLLACSGAEALSLFEERRPDCVLLDVRMPGMDGLEVCRRLRRLPTGAAVPVIFLTASRDVDTFDAAREAGGDDFITKPVQTAEMILRVQMALKVRRLDASNQEYFELVHRQRDDLMRLQLLKERLSSFVVHDLKNPVSSIDLLAQLLIRDRSLSADARETAASIRLEVASMMRLILNLLDINRSEEGALKPAVAKLDLTELADAVFDAGRPRASAKGIELVRSLGNVEAIWGDRDLLRRVLENLLENALRYSPDRGRVTLEAIRREDAIELRVVDQGKGVPEAMRSTIFDRFVQLAQPAGDDGRTGRGLGLTFCRLAVEAHGGCIYVEDAAPGAAFCIRLPARG